MKFKINDVVNKVKQNKFTIIVVNSDGKIVDCCVSDKKVSTDESFEILSRLSKKHKNCSAKILLQNLGITEDIIKSNIRDCVESIQYAQDHELKPGVNIPRTPDDFPG